MDSLYDRLRGLTSGRVSMPPALVRNGAIQEAAQYARAPDRMEGMLANRPPLPPGPLDRIKAWLGYTPESDLQSHPHTTPPTVPQKGTPMTGAGAANYMENARQPMPPGSAYGRWQEPSKITQADHDAVYERMTGMAR